MGGLKTGAKTSTVNLDSFYFKSSTEVGIYCLASPSAQNNYRLLSVRSGGDLYGSTYYATGIGFRPLVCLNSDVYLLEEKNRENSYTLNID